MFVCIKVCVKKKLDLAFPVTGSTHLGTYGYRHGHFRVDTVLRGLRRTNISQCALGDSESVGTASVKRGNRKTVSGKGGVVPPLADLI